MRTWWVGPRAGPPFAPGYLNSPPAPADVK
jgi:hypothetical protein